MGDGSQPVMHTEQAAPRAPWSRQACTSLSEPMSGWRQGCYRNLFGWACEPGELPQSRGSSCLGSVELQGFPRGSSTHKRMASSLCSNRYHAHTMQTDLKLCQGRFRLDIR